MTVPPESAPHSLDAGLLPAEPIHPQAPAFHAEIQKMLDGAPKAYGDVQAALAGWDDLLEEMAADSYRIASMLVGDGEDGIAIIEKAVATAEFPVCSDSSEARHNGRVALAACAVELLASREPLALAAPSPGTGPASCIEDDDLSAAGVTAAELEGMLNGPDRERLRSWLEGLGNPQRVIFVLRAVAGLSSPEVAGILSLHGGDAARGWAPEAVRESFRAALCSLASQLIQASSPR